MSDQPNMPQPPSDDEIEARLRKVLDEMDKSDLDLPSVPTQDEIDARLGRVRPKTNAADGSAFPEVPKLEFDRRNPGRPDVDDKSNYRGLGVGISAAYLLVGCMVMGFGIGWIIDKSTGSTTAQPIAALVGCIVGIAATIWLINRPDPGSKK